MKKTLLLLLFIVVSINTNAQTDVSGIININTTWSLANSPYIVTANILVAGGVTLTIEPGVVVKVNSGLYIKNEGTIIAVGTNSDKITFESSAPSPVKSDWIGIKIRSTGGSSIDGNLNYTSGSQFKYVIIKHAIKGIYVYNAGIHISYSEFETNFNGIEIRSSNGVVIDNSIFKDNTAGIWSEYEDYTSGDFVAAISNTYINNNTFVSNTYGIQLNMNQRDFTNLNITKNIITKNSIGIDFGGGGYGPIVNSVLIKGNKIYNNSSYGVILDKIYGSGTGTTSDYPLEFTENIVSDNDGGALMFEYSGIKFKIHKNIIKTSLLDINCIASIGSPSANNHLFTLNTIISKGKNLYLGQNSLYYANNLNFTYNLFYNSSNNEIINIKYGSGHMFNNNNFYNTSSTSYFLNNQTSNPVDATNNYWGNSTVSKIQSLIYDYSDNFDLGNVNFSPILNSPNTTAPISLPQKVVKSLVGNDVFLTWDANGESDTAGYKLYYGNPTGYSYSNVIDLGNVNTYTIVGGNINTEYVITAYDTSKTGVDDQVNGNESWFSIADLAPELPTNIIIDSAPRKFKLSWNLSASTGVSVYKIFRGITTNPTTEIASVSNTTNNFIDTGLTNGTTYYYRVKTISSNGLESEYSTNISAIPTSIWNVAKTGSDSGFGSVASPLSKIQLAINASVSGDIVLVNPGTYAENINYNGKNITVNSLYSSTLDESNIATTIIDGGANGLPVVTFNNGETNNAQLIGFTIQNGFTATNEWGAGIEISSAGPNLKNLIIKNNNCANGWPKTAGIRVYHSSSPVLIQNVEIKDNVGGAIYTLTDSDKSVKILNCEIHDNTTTTAASAIYIHGGQSSELTIENTLIYNNISSGASLVQGANLVFLNSTLYNNNAGINLSGNSGIFNTIIGSNHTITNQGFLKVLNSLVQDGQNSIINPVAAFLTYSNSISGNPIFVDVQQDDLHLTQYSPAIGKGSSTFSAYTISYNSPLADIDGNMRPDPLGSNIDLGAYENTFATTQHNNIIYVATNGNNSGSVGLESAPFSTIQAAIDYAINGDEILVKPGTYQGVLSLNKAITLSSTNGYEQTTIKSTGTNEKILTIFGISDHLNPIYTIVKGFKFTSDIANNNEQVAIRVENAAFSSIEKCWFENVRFGITSYYGYYNIINSVFNNVEIVTMQDSGYTVDDRLSKIISSTIINANSIINSSGGQYSKIYNTIIVKNGVNATSYFNGAFPLLSKVLIDANPSTQPGSVFTQIINIDNVHFTDYANLDFTLKSYSPAIGYGSNISNISDDIIDTPRPSPSLTFPDLGAYENLSGTPSNAPPLINGIAKTTVLEDAVDQSIGLLGIDDGDLLRAQQNLSVTVASDNPELFSNLSIEYSNNASTGNLLFTPALNKNGSAIVTVTVKDDGGTLNNGIDTKEITFEINITPVNDTPISFDDAILVAEGGSVSELASNETSILANDADIEDSTLNAVLVTDVVNGTLTLNPDGTLTYVHDGSETTSDSFTYYTSDGELSGAIATVTITITPVNDAPISFDDAIVVAEGGSVSELASSETSVLANDTDAENEGLTSVLLDNPINGTLTLSSDGTFTYVHDGSETTTDSFTYKANDGLLDSNTATITITISPVNNNVPTDIQLSNLSVNENQNNQIIGKFSATDLDSIDLFAYELVSGNGDTNNGNFIIVNDQLENSIDFDYEVEQTQSVRIKVTDQNDQSFEKIFIIDVTNVNDIAMISTKTDSYCAAQLGNGNITIDTITQTSGDISFLWTASNGGIVPEGQQGNRNLTDIPSGTYSVAVSDSFFTYSESYKISLIPQFNDLSICYVSSDDTEVTKNRIFLKTQGNYNVAMYEILRESNIANDYAVIGTLNSTENSYLDDNSNNTSVAYKYKVRLVDNCGNASSNSSVHKTLLLQSSVAVNNSVNLSWSHYDGTSYETYDIFRKTNQDSFQLIASISASNNAYNDQTADVLANKYEYYVAIDVISCATSVAGKQKAISTIKSNLQKIGSSLSIDSNELSSEIILYPNPTSSKVVLKIPASLELKAIEIYSTLGQLIKTFKVNEFFIDDFPSGTYLIKIFTDQGTAVKNFIKE